MNDEITTRAVRAPLRDVLIGEIAAAVSLSVPVFMNIALMHPQFGYYTTRDPLGSDGDFITAPEVSQMFGELIGLFFAQTWLDMGSPDKIELVEMGPGRGVMAADMLRVARVIDGFSKALSVSLIEASPALQAVQADVLAASPSPIHWKSLRHPFAGEGPLFIVGNEFLDCLPSRQFVKTAQGWFERRITHDPRNDRFVFVVAGGPASPSDLTLMPQHLMDASPGTIWEDPTSQVNMIEQVVDAIRARGGRALFIDYGPAGDETGDSLQAVSRHEKVNPLAEPGSADITMRVAFKVLRGAAISRFGALGVSDPHACVSGIATQAHWLEAMGILPRLQALIASRPEEKPRLLRQVARLTDPDEMGSLFKVIAISSPGLPPPPGFSE